MENTIKSNINFKLIGGGIIFAIIILILSSGIKIIETGNVGVKSTVGQIDREELKPGFNFAFPIFQKIEPVFTKTVMIDYSGNSKKPDTEELYTESSLKGEDKTGLEMAIDMIVEVDPQPEKQADQFIEVGRQGFDKKVLQPIRSTARKVLGQFSAEDIMSQRKEVELILNTELENDFSENPYYKLVNVQLKKIYLPTKVKNAIEAVQLAKQDAKAKKELIKANKALAESKVELAKGEANAIRETAQAEADKITMKADAQAVANIKLSKSITPELLKYRHIEAWKEGGAQVPKFISGGESSQMFMIDTK